MLHPSNDIVGTKGNKLENKNIILCITGSVACVRCPEIARELMRQGACIYVVMSKMAQKIIHPDLMEWATGNPVITELTGKIEHVALCKKADLVLIAPATANTISKIACGIDDTTVTSLVSVAFGSGIPIYIVPAMHESMYRHSILAANIEKLKKMGCEVIGPDIQEGKAKIASVDKIVEAVLFKFTNKDMSNLSVLVTAGPTIEYIDPIRIITNLSSGKMGIAIAQKAYQRGAKVTLIYGPGKQSPPQDLNIINVKTTEQMRLAVLSELHSTKYDIMFAAAACADFTPVKSSEQKIATDNMDEINLRLTPTKKIINEIKRVSPHTYLVAFKAECNRSFEELTEIAYARLRASQADLIIANDIGKAGAEFQSDTNEVVIVDANKNVLHIPLTDKTIIADKILDFVVSRLKK